jgi:hypothetical protein
VGTGKSVELPRIGTASSAGGGGVGVGGGVEGVTGGGAGGGVSFAPELQGPLRLPEIR